MSSEKEIFMAAILETTPALSKEMELHYGTLIQKKLSAECATKFEKIDPELVIHVKSNREDVIRGIRGMTVEDRRKFTYALAKMLNSATIKQVMDWDASFEYFTYLDYMALTNGWSKSKIKDFSQKLDKAGRELSSKQNSDGIPVSERNKIIKAGNIAARELVKANVLMVRAAAHDFERRIGKTLEHDELVAQGLIGLWKAVLKYDPERGNKFSTVAYAWIRQSITREVNNTCRLVRLPENRVAELVQITRVKRELADENLSESELDKVVAERVGITVEKLHEIVNAGNAHFSLDKPIGTDEGVTKELQHFVVEPSESAETVAESNYMQELLDKAFSRLSRLEAEAVVNAFRLSRPDVQMKTVKAICREHSIPQSEFKVVVNEAMNKIKDFMDSHKVAFADFF